MPPRPIEPCPPYTKVVSGFHDWRVINGIPAQHAGVDKSQDEQGHPMPSGVPFIASIVGGARVHFAGWGDKNTGNMVILRQGLWEARGMHLRDVVVQAGQDAPETLLLGHCDNTGLSTGTHLHYDVSAETRAEALLVQPDPVLAYGRWRVDPQLLLEDDVSRQDVIEALKTPLPELADRSMAWVVQHQIDYGVAATIKVLIEARTAAKFAAPVAEHPVYEAEIVKLKEWAAFYDAKTMEPIPPT